MNARLLLLSPPVLIAVVLAIEWALTRNRQPSTLAELIEGDAS